MRLSATQLAGASCHREGCRTAGSSSIALPISGVLYQTILTILMCSACLLATSCSGGTRGGTETSLINAGSTTTCHTSISFGCRVLPAIILLPLLGCCTTEDWSSCFSDSYPDDDRPSLMCQYMKRCQHRPDCAISISSWHII